MPDGLWLPLLVKMAATGLVVVLASVAAERAGPWWGGLIASLPVAAGPGYVFLAIDAAPDFVAASALMSLAANVAVPPFLLVQSRLAPHANAAVAVGTGLLVWLVLVLVLRLLPWNAWGVVLANVASFAICGALLRVPPVAPTRRMASPWFELPLRAVLVGLVVAVVVTASQPLGPSVTGIGVVFPVAFSSLAVMLHLRLGGAVAAATMARALLPMVGFTAALLVVHLATIPLGIWPALGWALLTSLAWSAALLLWNRVRRA